MKDMHEGPITYDCIIACDWCRAYNPRGTRNYLCYVTGCPDLEPDPISRRAAYIRKLRQAIQDGSAERVDFAVLTASDLAKLREDA